MVRISSQPSEPAVAMIRSSLDPEVDGEPMEYAGRFMREVQVLEMKTRLMIAEYFTGESAGSQPQRGRLVVLHDALLRHTGLSRLSVVLRDIIRDQPVEQACRDSWLWLPRSMQLLAEIRNGMAHMAGPWTPRPPHDRREAVWLLGKVYSGTIRLWGLLTWPDEGVMRPCQEQEHDEAGDRHAALLDLAAGDDGGALGDVVG